ncbi:MAG: hypothetical protein AB7L92_07180 [Alphaproteobacteria bacterium]
MADKTVTQKLIDHLKTHSHHDEVKKHLGLDDISVLADKEAHALIPDTQGSMKTTFDGLKAKIEAVDNAKKRHADAKEPQKPLLETGIKDAEKELHNAGIAARQELSGVKKQIDGFNEHASKFIEEQREALGKVKDAELHAKLTRELEEAENVVAGVKARGAKLFEGHNAAIAKAAEKTSTGLERAPIVLNEVSSGATEAGKKSAGFMKAIGANWSHGKGMGKAKVAVGALGLATSIASGLGDLSSKTEPDGTEREARPVLGLFKIGAGGALSLMLASHGGKSLVR